MADMNYNRYKAHPTVDLPDRKWPSNKITKAPIWCSVDLRDGNQALEVPMTLEQKVEFFEYLCSVGFVSHILSSSEGECFQPKGKSSGLNSDESILTVLRN